MQNTNNDHIYRAIEWVEIAEADLKTSRHLYEIGDYSNSIYHLQQAVEKGVKSIILYLDVEGKATDDYLRKKVGHFDTYKYFYDLHTKDEKGKREDIPQDVDKLLLRFKTISEGREHPKEIPTEDYELIIDMLTLLSKPASPHNIYKITHATDNERARAKRMLRTWRSYAKKNYRNKPYILKKLNDEQFQSEFINSYVDAVSRIRYLHYLSAITPRFLSSTRYPENGINPLEFYTPDNIIIKDYWILYEGAYFSIKALKKHYKIFADFLNYCFKPDTP